MRYLLLFLIAYFLFRSVGRLLSTFRIEKDPQVDRKQKSSQHLGINRDDVEDADFKDVE